MDAIGALRGNQAHVSVGSMDGERVFLQRKGSYGIFAPLVVYGLAIVLIQFEDVIFARKDIEIKFCWVLNASPTDLRGKRNNSSGFGENRDIFQPRFDRMPFPTLDLLAVEKVEPAPSR